MYISLTALGTGSAFTLNNYQSNFLLTCYEDDKSKTTHLLIDCGSDARLALHEVGLTYRDITDVYISHLHADHIGGLEWLGYSRFFDPNTQIAKLHVSRLLVDDLWTRSLSGGMRSLGRQVASIDTYFNVFCIDPNDYFLWNNIKFQLVQTCHVMNGWVIVPSFGLLFTIDDKTIFITTDTQYAPEQIYNFYQASDLILHDCETLFDANGNAIESKVHAHYNKLKTLDKTIKSKMWLYHYSDNASQLCDPAKDGFLGFLQKGQIIDLLGD